MTSFDATTPWTACWIAASAPEDAARGGLAGLDADVSAGRYDTSFFYKEFMCDVTVDAAVLRITSDSRHTAYLNGHPVARGPFRSQPHRLEADLVDVTQHLQQGLNVLAVNVTYYGEANAIWMPASGSGGLGTQAALVAELHLSAAGRAAATHSTDGTWRVHRDAASRRLPRTDVEGLPAEVFDARLAVPARGSVIPPEAEAAIVLPAGHMSGGGRATPPADPYGSVPTVARRPFDEVLRTPIQVTPLEAGAPSPSPGHGPDDHPSERVASACAAGARPRSEGAPSTELGVRRLVQYDYGRIVAGHIELQLEAAPGTEFDLDLREYPIGEGPPMPHGLRYIARGEGDRFVTSESHGLRYAVVAVSGPGADTAVIRRLVVHERTYPRVQPATLVTDDEIINDIWAAGVRSVQLNSTDAYTDCPTREQRAWVGDGVVHLQVDLVTNADHGLARRYVALAMSPRADGILPMAVAGDIEAAHATTIPAWSLHWIHALHQLARHHGIDELVLDALPVAERALRWFEAFQDEQGTLRDIPEWNFVDWSSVYTHGRSSILTGLWARGLREFAELARGAENLGSAGWAAGKYDQVKAGFEDFWDSARGLYRDCLTDDDTVSRATSQLASAAAIASGLAPEDRWTALAAKLSDPELLVHSSWYAGPEGFDLDAIAAASGSHPAPSWNVEREIVRAQPFASYIVHDALAAAGATDELIRSIRDWKALLCEGGTLREGWGWGTTAHAWSSTPTRDLICYVLGLTPADFGGRTWRLRPRLGPLGHVHGRIPVAGGAIDVRAGHEQTRVATSVPLSVELEGRQPVALEPGAFVVEHPHLGSTKVRRTEAHPRATASHT